MDDLPQSPLSELQAGAITLHELMLAYENAGFTHQESFELTKSVNEAIALGQFVGGVT